MKLAQQSNWQCDICDVEGVNLSSLEHPPSGWVEPMVFFPSENSWLSPERRVKATICNKCYVPSNRIGHIGKWFRGWYKKWAAKVRR